MKALHPMHEWEKLPRLLRHLAVNLGLGATLGVAFTALLVAGNVAGLGALIEGSGSPLLAKIMLCVVNMLTFGSLAMAISIMVLPWEKPQDGEKRSDQGGGRR